MRMCHFRVQNSPICPEQFLLVQTIIITFIYLLALFIVQNLKKFLQLIQSYEDTSFLCPKWLIWHKQKFFLKKIIKIIFIYILAPFILQNLKKIFRTNPELWGCAIFGPKIPQFVLNKDFWYKTLLSFSSTYWPFSMEKILKKFLKWIQDYEDASFLDPKWSICPKLFFWKKSLISFSSTYWPLLLCKI